MVELAVGRVGRIDARAWPVVQCSIANAEIVLRRQYTDAAAAHAEADEREAIKVQGDIISGNSDAISAVAGGQRSGQVVGARIGDGIGQRRNRRAWRELVQSSH